MAMDFPSVVQLLQGRGSQRVLSLYMGMFQINGKLNFGVFDQVWTKIY